MVVGGGVAGASTALHLALLGRQPLLLEADQLTCGTTWYLHCAVLSFTAPLLCRHSAAMLNTLRASPTEAALVAYTKQLAVHTLEQVCPVPSYIVHRTLLDS